MTAYYARTANPPPSTLGRSGTIRDEFDLIDTAFGEVATDMDLKAPLASPALTGTPTAPTATPSTDTTQIATTAFVQDVLGAAGALIPTAVGKLRKAIISDDTTYGWDFANRLVRAAKTANYTTALADYAKVIDFTASGYTLTMPAVGTLDDGWWQFVRNSSTGDLTIDPDASETIEGATTYTLRANHFAIVQGDDSVFRVPLVTLKKLLRLPIFHADAAAMSAVSSSELMENTLVSTSLASTGVQAIWGNSLFLVATTASSANISTSPDGITWTLRAMPSTAAWNIATNGTDKFVGTVPGATTTAKSTDGTTWVAGTALAAAAKTTFGIPVFNGSTCFVLSSTAATAYTSTDNGANWTTQTLPANSGSCAPFVVNGLFWYYSATNVAYTSATGATGTWTARTLSVTPVNVWQDFDGSLGYSSSYTTINNVYRTTDGITSAAHPMPELPTDGLDWVAPRNINGVYATFNGFSYLSRTTHNGAWVDRRSRVSDNFPNAPGVTRCAKNTAGTVFLIPHNTGTTGLIGRVAPAESTAATAVFNG